MVKAWYLDKIAHISHICRGWYLPGVSCQTENEVHTLQYCTMQFLAFYLNNIIYMHILNAVVWAWQQHCLQTQSQAVQSAWKTDVSVKTSAWCRNAAHCVVSADVKTHEQQHDDSIPAALWCKNNTCCYNRYKSTDVFLFMQWLKPHLWPVIPCLRSCQCIETSQLWLQAERMQTSLWAV